ncbi:sensor histidine kinase [Streptomyces sp. UNOC14_S4]|uniref:sensor histidine kinase n=1 Tax=Streptomyces sp. UNOC14_S4 TaxID=2872340 RepID=UPI001E2B4BEC|nr:ATP-binding protein [Streptomyces sp. UNOC14_S4]MCC3766902.1 ATP-binding protein [Streptomyces sp. UNOC14_S4]
MDHSCGVVSEALSRYEPAILADLRKALQDRGNEIADPLVWDETCQQARGIIEDCAASLRHGRRQPDERALVTSARLGLRNASRSVHPAAVIRACSVLFDVSLPYLRKAAAKAPPERGEDLLLLTLHTFNRSVGSRVEALMRGYHSYLLTQVGEANTADRLRLSRDVHDHLGNALATALRFLELHAAEETDGVLPSRLAGAHNAVQEAIGNIQALVNGLRIRIPGTGLEASLNEFLESVGTHQVRVDVVVCGDEGWVAPDRRQEVFVILRECLRNALSHARAERIVVWVDITPDEINATVEDDGIGFDPTTLAPRTDSGLSSVRERAGLQGGSVDWHSGSGAGTRVTLCIPSHRDGTEGAA